MLEVRKSNPNKPVRIMCYGVEGVGKSTLGAKAQNPIFISPEGGTDQLGDVAEMPDVTDWDSVISAVAKLGKEQHNYQTLVIDSADWLEGLAHTKIIGNSNKSIITCNGGYGAGFRESQSMHQSLIKLLSQLREERNMNIVVTAHAHVKNVKDPSMMEDYEAFEIKCHEFVSSLWREWVDGLFFARFRTFIKAKDGTVKARALSDGTRVVYTVKQAFCQAKNRYGMPAEMEFNENFWSDLMRYSRKTLASKDMLLERALLISDDKTRLNAVEAIKKCNNEADLLKIENRLFQITKGA